MVCFVGSPSLLDEIHVMDVTAMQMTCEFHLQAFGPSTVLVVPVMVSLTGSCGDTVLLLTSDLAPTHPDHPHHLPPLLLGHMQLPQPLGRVLGQGDSSPIPQAGVS